MVIWMTVVSVEPKTIIIMVDIEHIEITVRIGNIQKRLQCHHPLNTLGVESNSASAMP